MCKPVLVPTSASGMFSHIALHKKVLYAGGEDGTLCQMVVKDDHALITEMHSIGSAITSLSFNPSHHKLAVGCSMVSEHCLVPHVHCQLRHRHHHRRHRRHRHHHHHRRRHRHSVAARSQGQLGHVPQLERAVPQWMKWCKISFLINNFLIEKQ